MSNDENHPDGAWSEDDAHAYGQNAWHEPHAGAANSGYGAGATQSIPNSQYSNAGYASADQRFDQGPDAWPGRQPAQPGGAARGYDAPAVQDASAAGFFGALFDFSFTHFITPKVVKFVYLLSTALTALVWLIFLLAGFSHGAAYGFIVLVVGPIFALLNLVFVRITLEFYLATVRMSQDIHHRLR